MSTSTGSIWDELERRLRQLLKDIERQIYPPQPERARVPVPVRRPQPSRDR